MIERNGVSQPYILFWFDKLPRFVNYWKTWGKAVVATIKSTIYPKVEVYGVACFMAGYCLNREGD